MTNVQAVYDCLRRHSDRPMRNTELASCLHLTVEAVGHATRLLSYYGAAKNIGAPGVKGRAHVALWQLTDKPYLVPVRRHNPRKRGRNGLGEAKERVTYPMPPCELESVWPDPALFVRLSGGLDTSPEVD